MYIHELEGWPRLGWDADKLFGCLGKVRGLQGRLIGKMGALGFELQDEANLQTLTINILKTFEIEGESLDHSQVRSSIARRLGLEIGGLVPSPYHVDGVVEMMLDATQRFAEPLTAERLFGWHQKLFPIERNRYNSIDIGRWRDDQMGRMMVVSGPLGNEKTHFVAPVAKRLEEEMKCFLEWFNAKDNMDPVIKAGVAHFWFITIHPFDDGNGRIARAIADMQLARADDLPQRFYSMSNQIRIERKGYYHILEQSQKSGLDITEWLQWFLECLHSALLATDRLLAKVIWKGKFWQKLVMVSINERQRKIVNRLVDDFEGKLSTTKWAKMAKCSEDTALRDIQDLISKGILEKEAGGGRSTRYILSGAMPAEEALAQTQED